MTYHQDDEEPSRPNLIGVGLAILVAVIGAALLVVAGVGTALIVIINTI